MSITAEQSQESEELCDREEAVTASWLLACCFSLKPPALEICCINLYRLADFFPAQSVLRETQPSSSVFIS